MVILPSRAGTSREEDEEDDDDGAGAGVLGGRWEEEAGVIVDATSSTFTSAVFSSLSSCFGVMLLLLC